jgi:DHA1 family bicyclomycin/chloramphenicol resistance-like MFS transporter
MPMIASYFGVGIDLVEITLTIFLLGFALGQFFGGPISDSIGRKKTSTLGLLGFSSISFMILLSSSIYLLWAFRFIQAFFGGLVVVNANATIRDMFSGKEAAKVFTLIGTISMVAPLIAPAIGSSLIHFFTWKSVFVFLGTYSFLILLLVQFNIKESFTKNQTSFIKSYLSVINNEKARPLIVIFPIVFSGMFIFISKSAFVYMEYFHVSSDFFPFFFGADVIFVMIMARLNIKLIAKYEVLSIIKFAILIQFIIAILLLVELLKPTLLITFILLTAHVSMLGLVYGNLNALILENFTKNAATATALIGVLNFTIGAIVATLVSVFHDGTLMPVSVGIFMCSLLAYFQISRVK